MTYHGIFSWKDESSIVPTKTVIKMDVAPSNIVNEINKIKKKERKVPDESTTLNNLH